MLQFSEVLDNVLELTLMMLRPNEFHAFVRQTPELVSSHCVVRTKLAQIRYEVQEGSRSVTVPNFDGTYVSVPNFFGIHNISFFKFLPDLKYLT